MTTPASRISQMNIDAEVERARWRVEAGARRSAAFLSDELTSMTDQNIELIRENRELKAKLDRVVSRLRHEEDSRATGRVP